MISFRFLLVVFNLLLFACLPRAWGYWIDSVELLHSGTRLDSDSDIVLKVGIRTPNLGGRVYQPSEIITGSQEVAVLIYPTSGNLTAVGHFTETIDLGVVGQRALGAIRVIVLLKPENNSGGTISYVTNVTILPVIQMEIYDRGMEDQGVIVWYPESARFGFLVEFKPFLPTDAPWEQPKGDIWGAGMSFPRWTRQGIFRLRKL